MSDVHYRLLDVRRWSLTGGLIASDEVINATGIYYVISPEVVNSLGGTPSSTIAAATIEGSDLKQSLADPLQPASEFTTANWVTRGWTDPVADVEAWKLQVRSWVLNNLDNLTINSCNDPFNFYLLDLTDSGTRYLVPIIYLGDDGEILPVVPEVVVTNYSSMALDQFGNMYSWGGNNGVGGPVALDTMGPYYMRPDKYFYFGGSSVFADDAQSYTWAWGSNSTGKLAANVVTAAITSSPVSVLSGRRFQKIFSGLQTTLALDDYSYAWAWGNNQIGALGNNSTSYQESSPVSVLGGKQWLTLIPAAGTTSGGCIGIDDKSYAWAWGHSLVNGDNTGSDRSSPVSVVGDIQWRKIVSGNNYNALYQTIVGLDLNSYAWAWGLGNQGQCGNNSNAARFSPVSVAGGRQALDINVHLQSGGILLDSNSYAWAWGYNSFGGVGDNTAINRSSPVSVVGGRQFRQLFCNGALDLNSYAWCWGGSNLQGYMGDNTTNSRSSPTSVVGGIQWDSVGDFYLANIGKSGDNHYIWGVNLIGNCQSSSASSPVLFSGQQRSPRGASSPFSVPTGRKFIDFDCDGYEFNGATNGLAISYQVGHVAALDESSYAWCWGANNVGQLGTNTTNWASSPISVVGGRQFTRIRTSSSTFASNRFTLALDSLGYAWAWGANAGPGALGDNTATTRSSPVSVVGGRRFRTIMAGSSVSLALDMNSYAWAWGQNDTIYCRVGDGTTISRSSPVSVVGGRQWSQIAISNTAVALDANGYAWAWGTGSTGMIGNNSTDSQSSPVSVLGGRRFRAVSCAAYCAVALDMNSYAWAWGSGYVGEMGTNSLASTSSPVSVLGGRQYDTIRAEYFAVAATRYKEVYVWGSNSTGALGLGDTFDRSSPTLATYIKNLYGR